MTSMSGSVVSSSSTINCSMLTLLRASLALVLVAVLMNILRSSFRPASSSLSASLRTATTGSRVPLRNMHIQSIPMCASSRALPSHGEPHTDERTGVGSGNNYAYLVSDDKTKEAVIIDPANPPE